MGWVEHRESESAQHAFGGPAPPGVLLADLDQLADEGQVLFAPAEAVAKVARKARLRASILLARPWMPWSSSRTWSASSWA